METMDQIRFASEVGTPELVSNVSEVDVLVAGNYSSTRYGEFEVTPDQIDEMISEFNESKATGRRQVDFDHKAAAGDSRAAGWIMGLRREGEKLKAAVEWTPLGREAVEQKIYRFQSAEYAPSKRSKTDGSVKEGHWLRGLTLTNRPFIEGMDPVSLSDDPAYQLALTPWSQAGAGGIGAPVSEEENDGTALSPAEIATIAEKIGIKWQHERFSIADLQHGIGEEMEDHSTDDKVTNALKGDHSKAARLAVAHLRKDHNYYSKMEEMGLNDDVVLDATDSSTYDLGTKVLSTQEDSPRSDVSGGLTTNDTKGKSMSDEIRSLLSLSDDADDAAVANAVKALMVPKDDVVTLSEFRTVKEQAEEATRELHEWKRDSFLGDMVRAGKLTPGEVENYRELYDIAPDKIRKTLSERTPVVKLGSIGTDDGGVQGASVTASASDPHRQLFADKVEEIMARTPGLDYGRAMRLAEQELNS